MKKLDVNKKLIALAIGSAFAAPALADTANVNVYGVVNTTLESVKATGSAAGTGDRPTRQRVTSNSSRVGFRGTEDLGGGTNAIFQFETGFNSDAGAWATTGRDTFVGLSAGWGTLKLGRLSSPSKILTDDLDFHDGGTGFVASQGLMNRLHNGALGSVGGRISNAIGYDSPKLGDLVIRALYGTNENKSNTGVSPEIDDKLFELSATFQSGPLYVGAALASHDNPQALGAVSGNTFTAGSGELEDMRVGARYKFGMFTVGLLYDDAEATSTTGTKVGRTALHVPFQIDVGKDRLVLQYTKADKVEVGGTEIANSDATMMSVGYYHPLSPRTTFRAYYAKITNKDAAQYDFDTGSLSPAAGADPNGFAVGVRHNF
jgi:predicted porin